MAEALGVGDAAAIVGNHGADIFAAAQIFHRFAGLKPRHDIHAGEEW